MKVEIAENAGEAAIICHAGSEEAKFSHKERTVDDEGKRLDEFDVLIALLNAASAGVAGLPRPEPVPAEGETQTEQRAREARNRKALEDYENKKLEEAEAEEKSARDKRKSLSEEPERRIHRRKEL